MVSNRFMIFVFSVTLLIPVASWSNNAPVITDIRVSYEPAGSRNIRILYNLYDADGDTCVVSVEHIQTKDRRMMLDPEQLDGDAGSGIIPGKDHEIWWITPFCPCHKYGKDFDFRITAFDGTATGGEMILVRGSIFFMGSASEGENASPVHRVKLASYYMDKFEVTAGQFSEFVRATGYVTDAEKDRFSWVNTPSGWQKIEGVSWKDSLNGSRMNYPVVYVSRKDADTYTNWVGKRLPTEAEWERAASAGDSRPFAWGEEWKASTSNHGTDSAPFLDIEDGFIGLAPVGSMIRGRSPEGFHDLIGNVWEWVMDYYAPYAEGEVSNPKGPETGTHGIIRGGSYDVGKNSSTAQFRHKTIIKGGHFSNTGFRAAIDRTKLRIKNN